MTRVAKQRTRCTAPARTTGEQCKQWALAGVAVCKMHGGNTPAAVAKRQLWHLRTGLNRLTSPIDEDDWEADPLNGYVTEYRRTIAAIRYCGEQIDKLTSSRDLVWGVTKQVETESTEFPGTDTTYEAKINVWEAKRFAEREHLTDLLKLWFNVGIAEKKQTIDLAHIEALDRVVNAVLIATNNDPHSAEVRAIVRAAFDNVITTLPAALPA